jgi:hypothetical protein
VAEDPGNVEHPAQFAVDAFWEMRNEAGRKQGENGKIDAGERGKVTAGQHMAKLEEIIIEEFVKTGIPRTSIRRKSGIELPGYYRPAKKWDVVVFDHGLLVAAIEFKSQVGPSFGNNVNNRSEEAIGSAADVWRAYEEGTFGRIRPWLGYFFLLEAVQKSTTPVSLPTPVFPVDPIFHGTSYADRYRILCQRLVRERLYDAACFLTTNAGPPTTLNEPDTELGFANFAAAIAGRVAYVQALPGETTEGQSTLI